MAGSHYLKKRVEENTSLQGNIVVHKGLCNVRNKAWLRGIKLKMDSIGPTVRKYIYMQHYTEWRGCVYEIRNMDVVIYSFKILTTINKMTMYLKGNKHTVISEKV